MAKQVEGIIYVTAHERVMHCIPDDLPIPAVMAYGYTESKKVPSIVVDDEHGAYEVVCHLIRHGHRRIGVVMGKKDSLHAQARLVGYQKALRDNGIVFYSGTAHIVLQFTGVVITMFGVLAFIVSVTQMKENWRAGVGEKSPYCRELICKQLEFLGAKLDLSKNEIKGEEAVISTDNSKIVLCVVPTNEELMIAKETEKIINN